MRISDNSQLILGAAACLGVVIAWAYRRKSQSNLPLPPSPPTWKLGGHDLPEQHPSFTIGEWIDEYGPLITLRSGFEKTVIVGRYKAAVDILENQGRLTADRPRMIAAGEMFHGGMAIGFAHWGERFRRMRRALHAHLQPKAAETYGPLQMSHVKNTVLGILDDPQNFQSHVLAYTSTTIMKITYGKNTPTSATDPAVIAIRHFVKVGTAIVRPYAYLVDTIPWLKYVPWYGLDLKREYESVKKLNLSQLNRVKEQMQSDVDIGPSFARHILENGYGLSETEMAFLGGSFFSAGSETTSILICTVFMAAACFPEEQAKVQAELDEVIGRHRAPTFADQESLPRLQAFISEALRWRPPLPTGAALRTDDDLAHQENYCIPAGTIVAGNHWQVLSISRDPDVFPEPDAFKPQRWIDDQGRLKDDFKVKLFVYGFGRRVCPGQHIANRSIFLNSLLIMWAFQLALDPTKPLDDTGLMHGSMPDVMPCSIKFEKRIPESELRSMMEHYPETSPEKF
ncbi:cytochrome P450 [Suillus clintonianus]|uniref:cytochrome P450 n=1 Tax=Suillus clintonianus TaxID=1904413 RepID=UPI001B85B938|nr:cytochrome P450 [Suillus clintonianus]KAG2125145.1 cytochrome P450 [Suillus clintonianus]